MPQLRDFLSRFRPAGAPGSAAGAAVPVDRARELEGEVGPVLALLDGTWAECEAIIGQARRDADDIVAAARASATAVTTEGALRSQEARDEAARQEAGAAADEAAAMLATARQQADQIRARAGQRMPGLVSLAVTDIRELLAEGP